MLFTKIKIGNEEIKLKPLLIGENASMTDYEKPSEEILIIKCTKEGGELWVSKSGYSIEQVEENIREVNSFDLQLEMKFTNEYSRKIKTKFGEALLVLNYYNT